MMTPERLFGILRQRKGSSVSLKPCPYRHVGDEGHILCDKIKTGEREVSPNICRACPISQINCGHLRAVLDNQSRPAITVRWGNGKTKVLDDFAQQSISMNRAACAAKVTPIHSARDCAGCALRQPLILADAIQPVVAVEPAIASNRTHQRQPRRAPMPVMQPVAQVAQSAPVAQAEPPAPQPAADKRSSAVAQKIIQIQEWLAKSMAAKKSDQAADEVQPLAQVVRPVARVVGEEKRVGWTD